MPTRQVRECPAGFEERDRQVPSAGQVAQGLGDVALPDPDGAVQHDRLCPFEEPQRREVSDRVDGELRGGGEVENLQAGLFFEPGGADPSGDRGRGPPVEFVLAEDLQELLVAEFAGAGLDEPDLQGVEHPAEFQ